MIRDKRRYISVMSSRPVSEQDRKRFEAELYSALMAQLGEAEYFRANPKVIKFTGSDTFVLKVMHERYEQSMVALTLIRSMSGKPIGLYTLKSSGTIKAVGKP
jgi:RNase P/RNase MRP subunit POP5